MTKEEIAQELDWIIQKWENGADFVLIQELEELHKKINN